MAAIELLLYICAALLLQCAAGLGVIISRRRLLALSASPMDVPAEVGRPSGLGKAGASSE